MEVRISRKFTVNVRQYESTTVEVEWGATHQDLGHTDADVSTLTDDQHARLCDDLESLVLERLRSTLKPLLQEADAWSEFADNLAASALKPLT